jgi:mono/diheme cytochrome c family protein
MSRARSIFFALSLVLSAPAIAGCGDNPQAPTGGAGGDGGSGGTGSGTSPGDAPTYYKDVAPILNQHCGNCHVQGGIAPFALLTYDDAKAVSGLMKEKTKAREMPPWNIDNTGDCNTYSNARWLSDADIATIGAWADAGAPEGDPKDAPVAPGAPKGLDKVDLSFDTGFDYTPDSSQLDEYRCFVVDLGLSEDRFVTGYEVVPGDPREVHHAILYVMESAQADAQAEAADAADPKPGYLCFGGPGAAPSQWTVGWAPGSGALMYPQGTGLKLGAGRKAVLQIHYNMSNGAFPDRTKVELSLEKSVDKQARIFPVGTNDIVLPPGQADAPATGSLKIPANAGQVTVWGVAPHMHQRGHTLRVDYQEGGQKACVVNVDDWNFHWQGFGLYDKPLTAQGGGTLSIRCGYDTTHETMVVQHGEGTSDEMCLNFLYVTQ